MLLICSIFLLIFGILKKLLSSLSFSRQDKFINICKYKLTPYALLKIKFFSFLKSLGLNF